MGPVVKELRHQSHRSSAPRTKTAEAVLERRVRDFVGYTSVDIRNPDPHVLPALLTTRSPQCILVGFDKVAAACQNFQKEDPEPSAVNRAWSDLKQTYAAHECESHSDWAVDDHTRHSRKWQDMG